MIISIKREKIMNQLLLSFSFYISIINLILVEIIGIFLSEIVLLKSDKIF